MKNKDKMVRRSTAAPREMFTEADKRLPDELSYSGLVRLLVNAWLAGKTEGIILQQPIDGSTVKIENTGNIKEDK